MINNKYYPVKASALGKILPTFSIKMKTKFLPIKQKQI